jgi:competence protein ComFC
MANILTNIFNLFFSEECLYCGKVIEVRGNFLCFYCLSEMPLTNFSKHSQNELELTFKGRLPLKSATSLLYFERKGLVQKLLHQLKYHGKSEIGNFLGTWLAIEMKKSKRFDTIDFVIPIPMHPKKEKERGYNQVMGFADAIAKELGVEMIPDFLKKVNSIKAQSSKNRFDRLETLENDYKINGVASIENRHVLLVDDIITTGATMEACGFQLIHESKAKLSLASMAFTP